MDDNFDNVLVWLAIWSGIYDFILYWNVDQCSVLKRQSLVYLVLSRFLINHLL